MKAFKAIRKDTGRWVVQQEFIVFYGDSFDNYDIEHVNVLTDFELQSEVDKRVRDVRKRVIEEIRKFATEGLQANGGWVYCCEELMDLLTKLEAGAE